MTTRTTRQAGGRSLALTSVVLLVAGLAAAGWVGWQLWGTTAISQHRHHQLVDEIHDSWIHDDLEPARSPTTTAAAGVTTGYGTATAIVRIPAFGADYAVPVLEGTSSTVLASGFGHRTGTADAGQKGNYVLAAHRVTHGEPLRGMPELEPGDQVIVETRDATYTYVLDTAGDSLSVTEKDTWVGEPKPVNPNRAGPGPVGAPRLLTLVTCADFTHTSNRLVAFGHLIRAADRA